MITSLIPAHMKHPPKAIQPYQIRQAIVALELGPTDDKILEYLDFLTHHIPTGALSFMHVMPRFDQFNTILEHEAESFISNYELDHEAIMQMRREIGAQMKKGSAVHIEFDIKEGDPLEELLFNVADSGADLAVIGQRSGVSQHGILAKNLVRKTTCDALIIPDQAKVEIRHILVPVDFSLHSVKALHKAIAIKAELANGAAITCLNVYNAPNLSVYKLNKTREQFIEILEESQLEAFRAFLHTYTPEEYKDAIGMELVCREKPGIAQHILGFAREREVSLIVMGAKGHSKVDLLLMGSITEKLLALNEEIPTLVVK